MKRLSLRTLSSVCGFSLVELSIVMVIIGTVATLGLEGAATFLDHSALETTQERAKVIDEALVKYRLVNGRLPCPAPRMAAISSNTYAKEDCGGSGSITSTNLKYGSVPIRDLNLPLNYALDGYGSKFNYIVTTAMTTAASFPQALDGVSIRTGKLSSGCTSDCQVMGTAAYVVFSSGYDGRGAVSPTGKVTKPCIPATTTAQAAQYNNKIDTQNCVYLGTSTAEGGSTYNTTSTVTTAATTKDVFYDSRMSRGFVESNYFDDIVVWRPKSRL